MKNDGFLLAIPISCLFLNAFPLMCFCKTDIGTEELAHQEMIASLVYKLIEGACPEDFKKAGWGGQWAQHGCGTFWADANGVPWSAKYTAAHR